MSEFKQLIEAGLFVSGRTLGIKDLTEICRSGNMGTIRRVMEELMNEYSERNSAIEIYKSDDRYGMRVKGDLEKKVMHLVPETDMSPAVLKTLALIAYEQPIKQSDIIKARGNKAYRYIRKLKEEEFIESRKSGRTKVLSTTPRFREYFQIEDLRDLVKDRELGDGRE